MMKVHVVDTNVLLVANRKHDAVTQGCIEACILCLNGIMKSERVALDDGYRIIGEYLHKNDPNRGKGAGDVFLKWLLRNKASSRCVFVTLEEHSKRGFHSFPEDSDLYNFDLADRKFVAVAVACDEKPPIMQATDAKWLGWGYKAEHTLVAKAPSPTPGPTRIVS